MKAASWLVSVLALLAIACSSGSDNNGAVASSSRTTPEPGGPAVSLAADLRTHLDLLLAEHVMIIAKETAAAANHSDEYASYTALLTSNKTELGDVMRSAFGNSSADEFSRLWTLQNTYLVDYGIGVVTHQEGKSSGAMAGLTSDFAPKFAALITEASGLQNDTMLQVVTQQANADKAFIDDIGAQKFPNYYNDVPAAYALSAHLGDALAERIAQKFPDKFPGDPTVPRVDRRVSLNLLLQQHAWLETMATEAVVASRDADKSAASDAFKVNAAAIARSLNDLFGSGTGPADEKAWADRDSALLAYASKGDGDSKQALNATVAQFSSVSHVQAALVSNEMTALIKVVDDQRAKSAQAVAGDDRAAATSMQPIGDAIATTG